MWTVKKWPQLKSSVVIFFETTSYPENFPNLHKNIYVNKVDEKSFARLEPYNALEQYLNDIIIKAILSLLPSIAKVKGMTLINFDTFFYDKILEKGIISRYFFNYAKKHALDKKMCG